MKSVPTAIGTPARYSLLVFDSASSMIFSPVSAETMSKIESVAVNAMPLAAIRATSSSVIGLWVTCALSVNPHCAARKKLSVFVMWAEEGTPRSRALLHMARNTSSGR